MLALIVSSQCLGHIQSDCQVKERILWNREIKHEIKTEQLQQHLCSITSRNA
jgi:hypothetical protein